MVLTYESVDNMAGVGVVVWSRSLGANKIHHLVLALSRNTTVRENDLQIHPAWILIQFFRNPESKSLSQVDHEWCSRGDTVTVKFLRSVMVRSLRFELG